MPFKSPWCAFHVVQWRTDFFIPFISDSHIDIVLWVVGDKMFNTVGQQIAHALDIKIDLCVCSRIILALLPEQHSPHTQQGQRLTGNSSRVVLICMVCLCVFWSDGFFFFFRFSVCSSVCLLCHRVSVALFQSFFASLSLFSLSDCVLMWRFVCLLEVVCL